MTKRTGEKVNSSGELIKRKKVPKALQENFIDPELVYAFGISAILHLVVFGAICGLVWQHYGKAYQLMLKELAKRPDIILNLKTFNVDKKEQQK